MFKNRSAIVAYDLHCNRDHYLVPCLVLIGSDVLGRHNMLLRQTFAAIYNESSYVRTMRSL